MGINLDKKADASAEKIEKGKTVFSIIYFGLALVLYVGLALYLNKFFEVNVILLAFIWIILAIIYFGIAFLIWVILGNLIFNRNDIFAGNSGEESDENIFGYIKNHPIKVSLWVFLFAILG